MLSSTINPISAATSGTATPTSKVAAADGASILGLGATSATITTSTRCT